MSRRASCAKAGLEDTARIARPASASQSVGDAACRFEMTQRSFFPALPLDVPIACGRAKGEACTGDFGFSAFGLRFSRLPLCSRFAIAGPPFQATDMVTDAGFGSVGRGQAGEICEHACDKSLPAGILCYRRGRKQLQQTPSLLGSFRAARTGRRNQLGFELVLSIVERLLVG